MDGCLDCLSNVALTCQTNLSKLGPTVYSIQSISQKIKIQNIENREGIADMIVPSRLFDRQFGRKFKNG